MSPHRPSVLLVEDDAGIRGAFRVLLEESGYRVAAAATGGEAMRLAAGDSPDVVVLDLGLPDVSGLDVARSLTAAATPDGARKVRVIALTGRSMDEDRAAAADAGCAAYLVKPVDVRALLRTVAEQVAIGR
jgi:DNA-binding response OmpR family regulator